MDKNSTRNLGLTALVALFAFYGFTANNLRIDSVSSKGIVIKYSKRGLASVINCPKVSSAIDETAADTLSDKDCFHYVASKTLENGDVEYTVTTYYKGFTSTGTKVYPKQAVANFTNHNEDFIIEHVRKSKAKFDESPAATETKVELANAGEESTEETPKPDTETEVVETTEEVKREETEKPVATNGKPEVTPPGSVSTDKKDDDGETETVSFDAETLKESIESYAQLKNSYFACQTESGDSKKLKSIIRSYDKTVLKYAEAVDKYDSSDDDDAKAPFDKLSKKGKAKLEAFIAKINDLDTDSDDEDEDENKTNSSDIACLLERGKEIKGDEAQFTNYAQNIQPILRKEMSVDSAEDFSKITKALNDGTGPIAELARGNSYITGSIQSDFLGAQARIQHAENNKAKVEAEKLSEPMKTQRLLEIQRNAEQIDSNLKGNLSALAQNNPKLVSHLGANNQYWMQAAQSLSLLGSVATTGATAGSATTTTTSTTTSTDSAELTAKQKADLQIVKLRELFALHTDVKGSARGAVSPDKGSRDSRTKIYKGNQLPQLDDAVQGIDGN